MNETFIQMYYTCTVVSSVQVLIHVSEYKCIHVFVHIRILYILHVHVHAHVHVHTCSSCSRLFTHKNFGC